jgi:catechol 2,3-dioxygenase-like lactoylglutathione lyase family enzyme
MEKKRCRSRLLLVVVVVGLATIIMTMTTTRTNSVVDAFATTASSCRNDYRLRRGRVSFSLSESNDKNSGDNNISVMMSETSFLSHVMLKVPSVDKSVSYWTGDDMGGKVTRSKGNGLANGEGELLSAFVEMGRSTSTRYSNNDDDEKDDTDSSSRSPLPPPAFSLELLKTNKETYSVGNIISYIGISKLLQFQNNLLGAIIANDGKQVQKKEKQQEQEEEPNGIPIKLVASAPGDYIAQFTLKSKNLTSTSDFYTTILGMENKAQDEQLLCLRYNNNDKSSSSPSLGVPTTLVFENVVDDDVVLEKGDCFDHIAIQTTSSNAIDNLYEEVDTNNCSYNLFMKPTTMFGMKVIGLLDPNGYKVVIAGK